MKFVVYRLADTQYATPVEQIESIERLLPIRPVPGSENFELGVANLRGTVISVQDLRKKLGVEAAEPDQEARLLIAQGIGYLVDAALDVIDVDDSQWERVAGGRVWNRGDTLVLEYSLV
ncbi:chemotaxis protein CheW [Sulfoacidibacillus thermotolerans]|uniref:CheW-like domain-containing protein n=1 Tax=Sulfoacidibacillus thermotolerans TaxID=1765684 RepID=A0A2U3DAR8_SULT2|nr:chemotaxis protein CheW [Sulfoacidibacillus thermotolerans]PWI58376.1 hypothetical protein BM613_03930 [Sulfoacidibacillus thermotolerans]